MLKYTFEVSRIAHGAHVTSKFLKGVLALAASLTFQSAHAAEPLRALVLKRAVISLKEGEVWGRMGSVLACDLLPSDLTWRSGTMSLDTNRFASVFKEETGRPGSAGASDSSLFDEDGGAGGLQVGARITEMHARICTLPTRDNPPAWVYRGSVDMTVDWQFFDPLRREVIAHLVTTARGEDRKASRDGIETTIVDGFRQNARALMQRQELLGLIQGNADSSAAQVNGFPPLTLTGSGSPGGRGLSDAAGSVVLVQTEEGHGSGFLISGEGHLLTNAHVVGKAKVVRIRWSDGFVTEGEVLRVDRRRDVALVKTSPHSRPALALRPGLARTGEVAFAIGTPLDPKFQGTVTRGIVSAIRIYDGMSFVQSDVTVNPGNSGGPLLDDSGRVIAITDLGYQPEGIPTGINLFIPIGDALDFLNLKVMP